MKHRKAAKMLAIGEKVVVIELKNENYLLMLVPKDLDDFAKAVDNNFIEVIR